MKRAFLTIELIFIIPPLLSLMLLVAQFINEGSNRIHQLSRIEKNMNEDHLNANSQIEKQNEKCFFLDESHSSVALKKQKFFPKNKVFYDFSSGENMTGIVSTGGCQPKDFEKTGKDVP